MADRRLRELADLAPGWDITKTGGCHYRLSHPEVAGSIFTGSTPSDWRAKKNLVAMIRRAVRDGVVMRQSVRP